MTAERYIGLMSGTSLDGVDAALIEIHDAHSIKTLATAYRPFSDSLKDDLYSLTRQSSWPVSQFASAELQLTELYADCVTHLLELSSTSAQDIRAIGAHGQTIRHWPEQGFTFQLLNPSFLAAKTGVDVACDFRRADLARGGQGAPLLPTFHAEICAHPTQSRCLLNIGGIANLTSLSLESKTVGLDTGPGNTLMNAWCKRQFGEDYDHNGFRARQGTVNERLLDQLLQEPYFQRGLPKSTGPELFNLAWLDKALGASGVTVSANDILRTLLELTSRTIADAIHSHSPATEVFVFGGGVHNSFLMERLKELMPNHRILSTKTLGIDPDFMEATAFAWLAFRLLHNQPGNLISVTGANTPALLGGWFPSSRNLIQAKGY
ncbi:MAG: anhydro-N-acetylmuramic acid kinase [Hahellaceae bacterium]|nr:anhydro-N-acetylmuramic acid kinase [Hahellaceae bacterium]